MLDLRTRSARADLGVTKALITGDSSESRETCRKIADWARRAEGYQAMFAPSAAHPRGEVLVIYLDVGPTRLLSLTEVEEERRPLNY